MDTRKDKNHEKQEPLKLLTKEGIILSGKICNIEISMLLPCGFNTYELTEIDSLTEEIRTAGLVTPLTVIGPYKDNTYRVLSGERRLNALHSIHHEDPNCYREVPCYIVGGEDMPEPAQKIIMEIANEGQRKTKDPILHRFSIVRHLMELADTGSIKKMKVPRMAAEQLGMSSKYARCYMDVVLSKDKVLQEMVEKKQLDIKLASILAKMEEAEKEMLLRKMEGSKKPGDSWEIYQAYKEPEKARKKSMEKKKEEPQKGVDESKKEIEEEIPEKPEERAKDSVEKEDRTEERTAEPVYDPSTYEPTKFDMDFLRGKAKEVMGEDYDAVSTQQQDDKKDLVPGKKKTVNLINYDKLEKYFDLLLEKEDYNEDDEMVYEKACLFIEKYERHAA
ncbi:MAG: ParB N-terminal domain-containing protein [Eubacteriales bacterium]|nr:ParB N-terminal domain-containing protein [Eubacteriales bacterium]